MAPCSNAGHPGSDYYVNVVTGTIQRQANPALAAGLIAGGYIGPQDWCASKQVAATQTGSALSGTVTSAAASAADPLAGLFQANIWIRVAEVALGLVLIAIGVARLTKAVPVATQIAKTAGAVAVA